MFRYFWRWLSLKFRARPAHSNTGRFDAIIDETKSEVATLIERYRRTRRAAK
jgi:hypothetical protein